MNHEPTTTLARIRAESPTKRLYTRLCKSLGGARKYGKNTPITVRQIVELNGFDDALWCLRTMPEYDARWRRLAVAYVLEVEHLPRAQRSITTLEAVIGSVLGLRTDAEIRRWAEYDADDGEELALYSPAREALETPGKAARKAAWNAAWAAWGAARCAVRKVPVECAWPAAGEAVGGAVGELLAAAGDAAWVASWAEQAAACEAAGKVAGHAEGKVAWSAAWNAAWAAIRSKQTEMLLDICENAPPEVADE